MAGVRLPIQTFPLQAAVTEPVRPFLHAVIVSGTLHVYVSQTDRGELVFGASVDPFAAYLLIRGLKTFALRIERQNSNAQALAEFLEAHPRVEAVHYPGLPRHWEHDVAKHQMRGFGGVVSFEIRGDLDAAARVVDACAIPHLAVSLGGVESLIEQPAIMSFYELTTEERLEIGIKDNLIRYSVGIEDADDLIADLAQALDRLG